MKQTCAWVLALLITGTGASAQNWTGAINSDWNDPGNWSAWPLDGATVTVDSVNYIGVMADPVIGTASVFVPVEVRVLDARLGITAELTVADRLLVSGEGEVQQTGGILTADRLAVDMGGLFEVGSGVVVVSSLLTVANGGDLRESLFDQGEGSVHVAGDLEFVCNAGEHHPTLRVYTGALTVDGDVRWTGEAPGAGSGRLLVEGGQLDLNGNVASVPGSTAALFIGMSTGVITASGPLVELNQSTDSILVLGGIFRLAGNSEVRNSGVLWSDPGSFEFEQVTELQGSGTYRFHILTIAAGANVVHIGPADLQVAALWSNAGSFDPGANAVKFIGQGPAFISGGFFHDMHVANTGPGVEVEGTCTVAGLLTLEQGLVHTAADDLLVLTNGAGSTTGSDVSHVNGPMRKIGASPFVFPVGKDGLLRRIGIQGMVGTDPEYTAEFFAEAPSNTFALGPGLGSVSDVEHWTLVRSGGIDEARVKLYWEDASASGLNDCDGLVVAHWNDTVWTGGPSTTTGACTGNAAGTVESDGSMVDHLAVTFGQSDGTLGLPGPSNMVPLRLYPQPADEFVLLPAPAPLTTPVLIDRMGRRMHVPHYRHGEQVLLRTAELPAGVYMLQVLEDQDVRSAARLLVVH